MTRRPLLRSLTLVVALAATGGAALAQSASCQRYRAELASLDRGASRSGQAAASAERQRAELGRTVATYRSLGCDRGGIFLFGGQPPAECGGIAQRIRTLEASYAGLVAQASPLGGNVEGRRQALRSAIEEACSPQREAALQQPRADYAREGSDERDQRRRADERRRQQDADAPRARGGSRMVCVRTCDGSFFPLNNLPEGRADADDMCQALCPGATTALYNMPSDGTIEEALSERGKPYMQLANALRYTKGFDPTCSCKKPDQTWAQALQKAEKMVERHRSDILVTERKAEELSRPKLAMSQRRDKTVPKQATPTPRTVAEPTDPESAIINASLPTGKGETSGIKVEMDEAKVIEQGDGASLDVDATGGITRKVRLIELNGVAISNKALVTP